MTNENYTQEVKEGYTPESKAECYTAAGQPAAEKKHAAAHPKATKKKKGAKLGNN